MASDLPPIVFDDDNPEWTEADFARARPAGEVLPAAVLAAFGRSRPDQLSAGSGELVTLELDADVIAKFKEAGPDWQARINAALRHADPWVSIDRDAA